MSGYCHSSGPLQWNIWCGFITESRMLGWALLPWNWLPGSALTISTSSAVMCGVVWCLFLKHRMTKNFLSGIDKLVWVNLLDFWMNILHWLQMNSICLPTSSHPSSILFLMTYPKQLIGQVLMKQSSSQSAMNFFSLIVNYMQKKNLMRPVILFTIPLLFMRSGLMKLDVDKVTRIVSDSVIEMSI